MASFPENEITGEESDANNLSLSAAKSGEQRGANEFEIKKE
jgi:hypothetical protein